MTKTLDNHIESVYKEYCDRYDQQSGTNVNYLQLGRTILAENYRNPGTNGNEAVRHNKKVVNSILWAVREKMGPKYVKSLEASLENALSELAKAK